MRKVFLFFQSAIFVVILSFQMFAQITAPTNNQISTDQKKDDVSITANITARELKFEIVPNPTVEFPGKHERETVWEANRENLPRPVEPGVTYRDIGIRLRIASRFADIERIVAEALGEAPMTEDKPETRQPTTPQNKNKTVKNAMKPISQTDYFNKKAINRRK